MKKEIRLLVLREKHYLRIINFPKAKEEEIGLKLFREREEGCMYDEIEKKHQIIYDQAVAGDAKAALTFLNLRSGSGYEYEGIEIKYAEEL